MAAPQVGQTVWFYPAGADSNRVRGVKGACAAIVVGLPSKTTLNLCVFDADGNPSGFQAVAFVDSGGTPPDGSYATTPSWVNNSEIAQLKATAQQLNAELSALKSAAAAISSTEATSNEAK